MDDETQKIIAEQMKILPKDVVSAIVSVDYKTKLQEITRRQRLLIDQAGKLEMETTLVMIGLEPLADYVGNLQRELGMPNLRAKDIALDISEHIFKPIRESLKAMNEQPVPDEAAEGAKTEPESTKFTNSNEINLNRDQILNEIENPIPLRQGSAGQVPLRPSSPSSLPTKTNIEIRPTQEIQTVPEPPKTPSLLETKMSDIIITRRQIVDAKPEIKLPEVKKRPSSGVDPYREEIK